MDSDRVAGTAKKMGGQAESALGGLTGDAKTQAEGRSAEAQGTVQAAYGQAREAVQDYAEQAQGLAEDAYEQGRRYLDEGRRRYPDADKFYREGTRAVSRQVGQSPIAAIMIAGAVGYILALLVHARR
ncbi:CsbD family protein [Enterovirga sp.]|uniref:CsbD family protein n=1 Tax=Enterovirga sp. TaxID=2026350 RepID=UPI0026210C49|nr:CsbD family protein [Enterovirga sp.]MDB5590456.1 hypothetical protein [Enterovirga sp.]